MQLEDIDLNLLLVFDELRRQRQVSATATALGMSQPGVSNALNRMRRLLEDELFLRTPGGMSPTPYAEQIATPIAEALATLRQAFATRAHFDPQTSDAAFTVALTDVGEIYFLADLMRELSGLAPRGLLSTRRSSDIDLKAAMERGDVDLALGFFPDLKTGFMQRRLFDQAYVCLMRADHPLLRGILSLEQFEAADQVHVQASSTGHGLIDEHLARAGIQRRIRLQVPTFMALAPVLQSTHMMAVVPERFALKVAPAFGLQACACPVELPRSAIHAIWHLQKHRDPASRWLRELVVRLFAQYPALAPTKAPAHAPPHYAPKSSTRSHPQDS